MKKAKTLARLTAPGAEPANWSAKSFQPSVKDLPSIPAVNWSAISAQAPQLLNVSGASLPKSDVIVITWADPERAAMEHVFSKSGTAMPSSAGNAPSQSGWTKYAKNLPAANVSDWSFWGLYRQVRIGGTKVLLFKSNTHLDFPGQQYLTAMINQLIADASPSLIMSIGTAGGAQLNDHVGTVRVVHAGTLYENNQPQSDWPTYVNGWSANWSIVNSDGFDKLLFPIPTKPADLQSIASQFNSHYKTSYNLSDLNPGNLNIGDPTPSLNNMTTGATPLLTADSFLVATTSGNLDKFACVEMDDAIIAEACGTNHTAFAFVRNISDPVQNANLPASAQGNWGHAIYDVYGLYTSYNGAVTAWALIASNA